MSKALREPKCFSRSTACAGQMSPPVQRRTDVGLAGLLVDLAHARGEPQTGQTRRETRNGFAPSAAASSSTTSSDLRDDVAGALHDDRVADPHVLARDLVLVVQRRVRDDDAADGDRLELGDRRQRAGAADLDVDVLERSSSPARPGICARSPSAGCARRSRAAPAARGRRPCRRRRRCRSRASRAAPRCRDRCASISVDASGRAWSAD